MTEAQHQENKSCNCIANWHGQCVAETCKGEIRVLDARLETAESRKKHYTFVVSAFADYFGKYNTDEDDIV